MVIRKVLQIYTNEAEKSTMKYQILCEQINTKG